MTAKEAIQKHTSFGFKLLIELVVIIFAVGIAWATLSGDVKRNKEVVDEVKTDQKITDQKVSGIEGDIKSINTEIKGIGENIKEIKESVKK